jgi:NitT/TauT family transport system permease protein
VSRSSWFAIRAPLVPHRATLVKALSFLLPLGTWAVLCSVWLPEVSVTDQGNTVYRPPYTVDRTAFDAENARVAALPPQHWFTDKALQAFADKAAQGNAKVPPSVLAQLQAMKFDQNRPLYYYSREDFFDGLPDEFSEEPLKKYREVLWENLDGGPRKPATGELSSPYWLPAPWKVAKAFYHAFVTPPVKGDPWLHQSLWHSCQIIFWGFVVSAVVGVPLGILCGTFDLFSKLTEPFIDFIRYMPAPAFGVLCVALLGLDDGPKIAIIWIGTFFQMVLVVANTTRQFDEGLLEAAQTLGAKKRALLTGVILPGILPSLYNDMRILLGWAWTYLIVAEVIGGSSGISYFINQQGKYRHFENVYAGIIMIGIIGLTCDQVLAALARVLFPWVPRARGSGAWAGFFAALATIFGRGRKPSLPGAKAAA